MSTQEPVLLRELRGTVMIAFLNRPSKGNALNRPLIEALDALAGELETEGNGTGGIRVLVVTGRGAKAFCAGADVSELDGIDHDAAYAQMRRGQLALDRLERLPIPVIAAVNGFALGGGLELAMAADLRVAGPGSALGQPEITLGNLPGWGGTQRLPRLVGVARATEMILTGELLSAAKALEWGLVNTVAEDPLTAATQLAERIAERNPVAVRGAKRAIRVGLEEGTARGLVSEAEAVALCCQTDYQRRAVHDFLHRKRSQKGSK